MRQIILLAKVRFKGKGRFYKSFFSLTAMKYCYALLIVKGVLSFVFTAVMLSIFCGQADNFGLDEVVVEAFFTFFIVAQSFGYHRSACNYIRASLDLYRLSSASYGKFVRKTVVAHCLVDFCFKLPILLLIAGFSCARSLHSLFFIVPGLAASFLLSMNGITHDLVKDVKINMRLVVSILKYPFKVLIFGVVFFLVFTAMKALLYMTKILLTSSASTFPDHDEAALLANFFMSCTSAFDQVKGFFQSYAVPLLLYLLILIVVSAVCNFRCYAYLWRNKVVTTTWFAQNNVVLGVPRHTYFPYLKTLYRLRLNNVFIQMVRTPWIIVLAAIETLTLCNMESDCGKFLFVLWFYLVGSLNYIRDLCFVGREVFNSYTSAVDLCYWRLAGRPLEELYEGKLKLLLRYTNTMVWCESIFACVMSLLFVSNRLLVVLSLAVIICLRGPLHFFCCRFATFLSFFTFARLSKSRLDAENSDEAQFARDRLQNLFGLLFSTIPIMIIVLDYLYSFLTVFLSLLVLGLLFTVAYVMEKLADKYIEKAVGMLEAVSVPD